MKIIVTGSLGNISKPLTKELAEKGHQVTVISSNPERKGDIETLGATAAIGKLEDVDFLNETFSGADAAYCMTPFSFTEQDQTAYFRRINNNYVQAIRKNGVKRVVNLSGWAANTLGSQNAENILDELSDAAITHLRPTYFYTNFYGFVEMIKGKNMIATNFGGEDKIVLVSPIDIADAIAEEISTPLEVRKVRYVASDELTCNEAANILGAAIGKSDLKWATLTDRQMQEDLEASGMPPQLAAGLVEMQADIHNGVLTENYYRHKPNVLGKVKLKDFAREFAATF